MKNSVIIVIPARYGSTRLPGKPLLAETGKYLIQHVYEAALGSKVAERVVVATDDIRIMEAVKSFGGEAIMTSSSHQSGTDRLAEVASKIASDVIINLQGDEPDIDPAVLDQAAEILLKDTKASIATLAFYLDASKADDPNIVKVVLNRDGYALYFSRSPIPYLRDKESSFKNLYLGHIGLYAYRQDFLLSFPSLPPSFLEKAEKLEQLRALENGYLIKVGITGHHTRGIDTPSDYKEFVTRVSCCKR